MDPLPTPEAKARAVLRIYQHFGIQPGQSLMTQQFAAVIANFGLSELDLIDGVRYGAERGWFEDGPGGSMRLTAAGFAEI